MQFPKSKINIPPAVHRLLLRMVSVGRRFRFNGCWESRIRRLARSPARKNLERPVVHLYAPCLNEQRIIPYFLDHYGPFVDEFHIYDKGSTDATRELLSACPKVAIVPTAGGSEYDEGRNLQIKNHAWKASAGRADFVVVCDMDEFLYHPNLDVLLALMKKEGFTVLRPRGCQMAAERLPAFDGRSHLTEIITAGMDVSSHYSKTILFDPNRLTEIQFTPGCHRSRPEGKVKIFHSFHANLLHYKYVDREEILRKMRNYRENLSAESRSQGWARHYQRTDEETMALYDRILAGARKVI